MNKKDKTEKPNKDISILVVDDEESACTYLDTLLSLKGYRVASVRSGKEALDHIKRGEACSVVILDVMMPEMDGLTTLQKIRELKSDLPVIMLSAMGQTKIVVEAMKSGASDYLTKGFEDEEIEIAINNVLGRMELVDQIRDLKEQLKAERKEEFISVSEMIDDVKRTIGQIADTDITVLIQGESGVGKEIVARYIYSSSPRRDKALIKVSCASIPGELLESELFGYEKGAFTGAYVPKPGRFGLANHGTIFLDEIGEMSVPLQAKLLQVLQDGVFTRLGDKKETHVDTRVLVATNKNLEKAVREGDFRKDLYHRLNVVNIFVPPLRERRDDIPVLCEYFVEKYNRKYNRKTKAISGNLMKAFGNYDWPGNVRELENIVRRVVVLRDEGRILEELTERCKKKEKYPRSFYTTPDSAPAISSFKNVSKEKAREVEKETILKALDETNWNRRKAAELLGINYKTLLYKLKKIL